MFSPVHWRFCLLCHPRCVFCIHDLVVFLKREVTVIASKSLNPQGYTVLQCSDECAVIHNVVRSAQRAYRFSIIEKIGIIAVKNVNIRWIWIDDGLRREGIHAKVIKVKCYYTLGRKGYFRRCMWCNAWVEFLDFVWGIHFPERPTKNWQRLV